MTEYYDVEIFEEKEIKEISEEEKTVLQIAEVAHEAIRAYNKVIGDPVSLPWSEAPKWQKDSSISGVKFALQNPFLNEGGQHEEWMEIKLKDGWKYGPVKNEETKEHPCLLPFHCLPDAQKRKDALFQMVVGALSRKYGQEQYPAIQTQEDYIKQQQGLIKEAVKEAHAEIYGDIAEKVKAEIEVTPNLLTKLAEPNLAEKMANGKLFLKSLPV